MRSPWAPLSQTPLSLSRWHTHSYTQEVVVWLSSIAQVSENRSELCDSVMHDDIIREKGRLLRRRECGMKDVGNAQRAWKGPKGWNNGWKFTLTPVFHEYTSNFPTFFMRISSFFMCNVKTVSEAFTPIKLGKYVHCCSNSKLMTKCVHL